MDVVPGPACSSVLEHLSGVFAHIQGRRTLPAAAARRLLSLLPNPFAAQPVFLG